MAPSTLKTHMSIFRENFILIGWKELHDAVRIRGAEIDYAPKWYPELKGQTYLNPLIYAGLLTNFPTKCGIELPSESCLGDAVHQQTWLGLQEEACKLARLEWDEILTLQTPAGVMNAFRSRDFLYRHPSHSAWEQGNLKLLAEKVLAILAYDERDKQKYIAAAIWALACLGAISKWFSHRSVCGFCFRLAWPGQRFCRQHSQAKPYQDSQSKAYLRYRTGRKAYLLAHKRGLLTQIQGNARLQSLQTYGAMADLLFPMQPDEDDIFDHEILCYELPNHPRTLALLGGKDVLELPYPQLVSLLRDKLDPNEWDNPMWPLKIIAAEIWMGLEEEVSPGKKPRSPLTDRRVQEALKLFQLGYTQKQIAERLKISPSALSKWKARGLITV